MTTNEHIAGRQRRTLTALAHVLFIIIIFILPELVMAIAMPFRRGFVFYPGFYAKSLVFIAIFYLNYFVVIDRTINRGGPKGWLYFIMANVALLAVGIGVCYGLEQALWPARPHRHRSLEEYTFWQKFLKQASRSLRDGVMIVLTDSLALALRLSSRLMYMDRRNQELVAEQRTTELANLKSQLNPHFLFNTLNTIYALVDISPEDAKRAVHTLSSLLRYMLYEDVTRTTLRREADFILDYVSLMRLRVADHPVNVDISLGDNADLEVPPLLFIPLVENAFKYGTVTHDREPVSITLTARPDRIVCTTSNSFIPKSKGEEEKRTSGIGLVNLRRRLVLIYGNHASLRTTVDGSIFKAELTLRPGPQLQLQP